MRATRTNATKANSGSWRCGMAHPPSPKRSGGWTTPLRATRNLLSLGSLLLTALAAAIPSGDCMLAAAATDAAVCPRPEIPVTRPTPVDVAAILTALGNIQTAKGETAFTINEEVRRDISDTFGGGQVKTKMEQFYATLFIVQNHSPLKPGVMHTVSGEQLQETLMLSGVFPDPEIPRRIRELRFRRSSMSPLFEVTFAQPIVRLPLNRGAGFSTWQHGMCQHAAALIFRSPFRFYIRREANGNLKVYKFRNVDLEGRLGTRGLLDLDLNYVSLISVEFIRGTPLGYVKARVADHEFEVNRHSWILKVVTSFFSDTTKQAIDW